MVFNRRYVTPGRRDLLSPQLTSRTLRRHLAGLANSNVAGFEKTRLHYFAVSTNSPFFASTTIVLPSRKWPESIPLASVFCKRC